MARKGTGLHSPSTRLTFSLCRNPPATDDCQALVANPGSFRAWFNPPIIPELVMDMSFKKNPARPALSR